jgi:hypothetical protein
MLPSTQQNISVLHLYFYLLRHVSVIHEHHQARIRIVIGTQQNATNENNIIGVFRNTSSRVGSEELLNCI